MLLIFFMHAMLAAIFPIGRAVLQYATPIFYTAARTFFPGLILLGYHYIRYQRLKKWSLQAGVLLVMLSLFGIYLTNVPEMWALQFIPSAKAAFIYSLTPFFTALLSYFIFDEKFTIKKCLGMIIGLLGLLLVLVYDSPAEISLGGFWFISWGEMALILASFSTVVGWIAMRKLVRDEGYSIFEANGITMIMGGLLALLHSFAAESPWNPVPVTAGIPFTGYVLLAGLTSSIIGCNLYAYLLKRYTATLISFVGFVEPLFAAFYAWVFLGETVSWQFYAASVTVFVGLYIFYIEELKLGYVVRRR